MSGHPIQDGEGKPLDSLPSKYPKCGAQTGTGYGLAYGGFGTYVYCGSLEDENEGCGWWAKEQEAP